MSGDLHGIASWPGALSIESCHVTVSHGIMPSVATLVMQPQPDFPAEQGDLTITDGNESVTLPNSKVDRLTVHQDGQGIIWCLTILDRRWRWAELGGISGVYNQLDPHGKLLPRYIRSPTELATLCLDAMGETGYTTDMPPGLPQSAGQGIVGMLPTGLNYPQGAGINPPINWDCLPPAVALSQLCDLFGRRVVYQLSTDTVAVMQIGDGDNLPDGSIYSQSPSLKSPPTPDAVGVVGGPTRVQMRLGLIAVGEEWDGTYRPINNLSYAPTTTPATQITRLTAGGALAQSYGVWLNFTTNVNPPTGADRATGVFFSYSPTGADTAQTAVINLAAQINASLSLKIRGKIHATSVGETLEVTGIQNGFSFAVYGQAFASVPGSSTFNAELVRVASVAGRSWANCPPPLYSSVTPTDRLTFRDAQKLAQGSVFRCYRISDLDVSGNGPIQVPGYGALQTRFQIKLTDTQVDQVVPQANDATVQDREGFPITQNLYQGYSRDKPSQVFGSVSNASIFDRGLVYTTAGLNTPPSKPILLPFSTDPVQQMVIFSTPIWFDDEGSIKEPQLILQAAVMIEDPNTNQLIAYTKIVPLPGQNSQTNPKMRLCHDVQLNITSTYNFGNRITSATILEVDPLARINYYIDGLAAQYRITGGETKTYNGIVGIDLDGAIQQVTWEVGAQGASTIASLNTEHDVWVPPFPARRRAENIPSLDVQQQLRQRIPNVFRPRRQ